MLRFVNGKWKVDRTDPHLVRFGLLWKIYDLVALKSVFFFFFPLPILESRSGTHPWFPYLLGELSGTDFAHLFWHSGSGRFRRFVVATFFLFLLL